jgi:basic membrane protein A and related proteins
MKKIPAEKPSIAGRVGACRTVLALLLFCGIASSVIADQKPSSAGRLGARGLVVLVSPLQFGVDVYLNMTRVGAINAARDIGAAVRIFESTDPETRSENIRAALAYGATLVIAPGPEFVDMVPDFAEDHRDVKFLMIEDCAARLAPNVFCMTLRTHEAGFLTGVEAALTSRTGRIGAIAPVDYPAARRFTDSFAAGARHVRKDVIVHPPLWIGGDNPWSDPLRAQSQAAVMLGDRVDRILATVAAGNGGVYKKVRSTSGALAIGLDVNECPMAPGFILDSAVRHIDRIIERAARGIASGNQPNNVSYGLKEGVVNLTSLEAGAASSQCVIAQDPQLVARVAAVRDAIASGELHVADPAGVMQ